MPKKKNLKPVEVPPRRKRNVTAAKAVNQKAGPFKRKPKEYTEEFGSDSEDFRPGPNGVFIWRDGDLPGGW